jgi:hypothetical protein
MLSKYTLNIGIKPLLFNDFLPYLLLFLPSIAASRILEMLDTTLDSGVATFQRDYISGVVSEAMEEWCSGVERRLWGLQYSLMRQLQQEETKAMQAESSVTGEMKEELSVPSVLVPRVRLRQSLTGQVLVRSCTSSCPVKFAGV